jgi:O-antigen/teichoic acid export membrane protein
VRVAIRGSIDTIIVSAFLGIVMAAKYQNYILVTTVPLMIIRALKKGIIPSLGNSMAMETVNHNLGITQMVYFIIHWVSTICAAILLCFYNPFMRIWAGEDAILSETATVLFVVYFYVLAITEVSSLVRTTSGVWWEGKWVAIIESVVNLILNLMLVCIMGIEGIILATIISMLFVNIPFETYYVYKYYFNEKPWGELLGYLKDFVVSIVAVGLTYVITRVYSHGIIDTFIIWVLECMLIPNIVLCIIHIRDPRLKELYGIIVDIIKNIIEKLKNVD